MPYNPYLLLKYGCKFNVEKLCSLKSLRYIFKYNFKGRDMATFRRFWANSGEQDPIDEIPNWVKDRYLSACEAVWDIFEFTRHGNIPPIVQLDLYLSEGKRLVINSELELKTIDRSCSTMLTVNFKLNLEDEVAKQFKYCEFPAFFIYKSKRWVRIRGVFAELNVWGACKILTTEIKTRFLLFILCYAISEAQLRLKTFEHAKVSCMAWWLKQQLNETCCIRMNPLIEQCKRPISIIIVVSSVGSSTYYWYSCLDRLKKLFGIGIWLSSVRNS